MIRRGSLPFAIVVLVASGVVALAWRWNASAASWPTTHDAFVRSDAGPPGAGRAGKAVWVTADFEQAQLARAHLGDRAEIIVDDIPDVAWTGYVDAILGEPSARRIAVKIVFDPWLKTDRLRPGMPVVATIKTEP